MIGVHYKFTFSPVIDYLISNLSDNKCSFEGIRFRVIELACKTIKVVNMLTI